MRRTRWLLLALAGVAMAVGAVVAVISLGGSSADEAAAFCRAVADPPDPATLGSDPSAVRALAVFVTNESTVEGAPDDERGAMRQLRRELLDAVDSPDGTLADADGWVRRYTAVRDGSRAYCTDG